VAVFERRVGLGAMIEALATALDEAPSGRAPAGFAGALGRARGLLGAVGPQPASRTAERVPVAIAPRPVGPLSLTAGFSVRRADACAAPEDEQLERADLHALLARGDFTVTARRKSALLSNVHVFLLAEKLLLLAEDMLEAAQTGRPLFRRVDAGGARLGVRRTGSEATIALSVSGPELIERAESITFPELDAMGVVRSSVRFARSVSDAFQRHDPSQAKNLRLVSLLSQASLIEERLEEISTDDSLKNPQPESYRVFGLPRARTETRGRWEHGGKMRFQPRWVATVPGIDLRATFLCGERIIVGSARETACLERGNGRVVWRLGTPRAASVVTDVGLARLQPDGTIVLHELETGRVRFTTQVTPRSGGGATGAVVHAPGLPKLLVLAEGDRRVTAVDLVSGDVRWRFTARRPANYRVRRAGKLLIVAGGDSALVALDASTGSVVWRVRDRLPFSGDLAIDHDRVLAICGGPIGPLRLHAVDLWSGEPVWSRELDERPTPGQAPIIAAGAVIVAVRDRRGTGALAFERTTGEPLWRQAPGLASPTTAWLSVDDAVIANSAAGMLLSLDARTGSVRYNHVFPRHVDADQPRRLEPVLRSGALFVPQHQVHVIRPRDGELIGTVPTDLIPDLLRVDEECNVYVAEESGHLAAFGAAPRLTLVRS
jgi:outer membrane protein assembly factor BamB